MSLILFVSPVFNVEISEAVCCFVIFEKKKFGKVKSSFPILPFGKDMEKKLFPNSILATIIVKSKMEWRNLIN